MSNRTCLTDNECLNFTQHSKFLSVHSSWSALISTPKSCLSMLLKIALDSKTKQLPQAGGGRELELSQKQEATVPTYSEKHRRPGK